MSKNFINRILSSIFLIPIILFLIIKGHFYFNLFLVFCFFTTLYEWLKMSINKNYKIIGFIFLSFSFYSIYKLRNDFDGEYLVILIITLICVSTDIGGYVFGKIFKGPKLTKLSPNKTFAGMIGGFFLSFTSVIFYFKYLTLSNSIEYSQNIIVLIFLISSVSQIGDIVISYFKRESKIKDTGKIIPGHGGLLDRIDGMVFAFPFSYIILSNDFVNLI
jgi:phosphatidate cytidylyltransferase